ncbi:MAG: hypothetical protein F4X93_04280 [Proteobacteria bacterium]|nr:hypothetical protein [Pseudomonadota bacterium]
MVFSAGLGENQPGCGTVVPCKSQNLIEEAEYLWTAERPAGSKSNGRISASDGWGRIALLINRACPERDELCDIWSNRVCQERDVYGEPMESAVGEEAAVDESGFLNTPWPKTEDGLDLEFDALLATATNPTIIGGRYASVEEIAGAWKTPEGKRFVCYFYNNRECGITTFQDNKIEKLL